MGESVRTLLTGGKVYQQGGFVLADVAVKKGQIEAVSIVMDQDPGPFCKDQEGGEQLLLIGACIVEPLNQVPAVRFIIEAADQIDPALGRREACRFYIQKEKI